MIQWTGWTLIVVWAFVGNILMNAKKAKFNWLYLFWSLCLVVISGWLLLVCLNP